MEKVRNDDLTLSLHNPDLFFSQPVEVIHQAVDLGVGSSDQSDVFLLMVLSQEAIYTLFKNLNRPPHLPDDIHIKWATVHANLAFNTF